MSTKLKSLLKNVPIALLLIVVLVLQVVLIQPLKVDISCENVDAETSQQQDVVPETQYKINVLDSKVREDYEKREGIVETAETFDVSSVEEIDNEDIVGLVYQNVIFELQAFGYDTFMASALDLENDIIYYGIAYTNNEMYNETYVGAGFVNVVDTDEVIPEDTILAIFNEEQDEEYVYLNDEVLGIKLWDHFVYENKYIKYGWQNINTIKYEILENKTANYEYERGTLFSYDEMKYLYDDDFTYTSLEVVSMFENVDYNELQKTLTEINKQQEQNGYFVQEITLTYIDSEMLTAWQLQGYPETLFGYDVAGLDEAFGKETSLEFTADGVQQAEYEKPTDWLSVLLMIGAGVAAILIGAALAPLTGGCSFTASLICICKITAIGVATSLLVETAIGTIANCCAGMGFFEALGNAVSVTITPENLARTFMLSAIMSAISVGSGLLKACFVGNTPVLTENGYASIDNIAVGDRVYSYDEATQTTALMPVTEVMQNTSTDICTIALSSGETITSTALHPWYVEGRGWVPAFGLKSGNTLLTNNQENVTILGVHRQKLDTPVNVYNISIGNVDDEAFHTYYVGLSQTLVHNDCAKVVDNIISKHTKGFKTEAKSFYDNGMHANSKLTTKKTELYVLRKKGTDVPWKVGETTRGVNRYTRGFYNNKQVYMDRIATGTKAEMRELERKILKEIRDTCPEYFAKHMGNLCLH